MDSINGRILIWKIVLLENKQHLLGNGINSFEKEYGNLKVAYFSKNKNENEILLADESKYCFNELLEIYFNYGIIIFLVFFVLIVYYIISLWKTLHTDYTFLKTSSLSQIIIIMHSLLQYNLHNFFVLLIFLFNLLVFVHCNYLKDKRFQIRKLSFSTLILIVFSVYFYLQNSKNEKKYYSVNTCQIPFNDTQIKLLAKESPELVYLFFNCHFGQVENKKLIEMLKAYSNKVSDYKTCIVLGDLLFNENKYEEALYYYNKAHLIVPNRFLPLFNQFKVYEISNNEIKKNELEQIILSKKVKVKSKEIDYYLSYVKNH